MDFTGIAEERNGSFSYRIKKVLANGEKIDTKIGGFPTKREAKNARDARLVELSAMRSKQCRRRIRYDNLYRDFIENMAKNNRKYTTLMRYESLHKNHIHPSFGNRWVDTLTVGELAKFLRTLKADGMSAGYIESFHTQLRVVLDYGVQNGYLEENPINAVALPPKDIAEVHIQDEQLQILSASDIAALLEKLQGKNVLLPFLLGYAMGLRVSEAYAIRWRDVDFGSKLLTVDKQLQYQDHMWCLVPPKSYCSYRCLDIPDYLLDFLRAHKVQQEQRRQLLGRAYQKTAVCLRLKPQQDELADICDFVCVKGNGGLLTPCSAKSITAAATELGIIGYHFHLLRHTHASQLANSNVSALLLRERLGHEKVETSWNYYSHVSPEARSGLSRALNRLRPPLKLKV